MEIGKQTSVIIQATQRWNDTQIDLVSGGEYEFRASGQWTDWNYTGNADGFESQGVIQKMTESLRRAREERWFCLMGSVDKNPATVFRIGTARSYQATGTGRLFCFANDLYPAYWNNKGNVQLIVTRRR